MAENSNIEWTDHTFNPWIGCTKISPGCARCYAETLMDTRYGKVKWGKGQPRQRTSAANWKLPLKWNRAYDTAFERREEALLIAPGGSVLPPSPTRPRVFCSSLADWLDDEVPIEWLADLLKLIHDTPNLDWLLLTKRPENWRDRIAAAMGKMDEGIPAPSPDEQVEIFGMFLNRVPPTEVKQKLKPFTRSGPSLMVGTWLEGTPIKNVWLGVSVENQEIAVKRIPLLVDIPAKVRFLSVEPLLGPIELKPSLLMPSLPHGQGCGIHWAIFGGESGDKARPCNWRWIESGLKQCRSLGIRPFVKQLGSSPVFANDEDWDDYSDRPTMCPHCKVTVERSMPHQDLCPKGHYLTDDEDQVIVPFGDKKGGDMTEWPAELRVREFPEAPCS